MPPDTWSSNGAICRVRWAPDVRDKLFQLFFATKPTGEGTGLGLSIRYDITYLIGNRDLFGFPLQEIAKMVNNRAIAILIVDSPDQLCLDFIADDTWALPMCLSGPDEGGKYDR